MQSATRALIEVDRLLETKVFLHIAYTARKVGESRSHYTTFVFIMLYNNIAVAAALVAVASAAPQAVSSASGTVTASPYIGNATSNVYPPTGSKY